MKAVTTFVLIVFLFVSGFVLGRRWESNNIRLQLENRGYAISKYGDSKKIKIHGTVEPYLNEQVNAADSE